MLRCCCSCPLKRPSPLAPLALALASSPSTSSSPLGPALARLPASHSHQAHQRRHSSTDQHFRTQHGAVRVNLVRPPPPSSPSPPRLPSRTRTHASYTLQKAKGAVGVAQSRGERPCASFPFFLLSAP